MNKTTYLKNGRAVIIAGVPNSLDEAITTFGSESKLVDCAVNYIIAHSLLAKARKLDETAVDSSEPLRLDFTVGHRSEAPAVKLDARKLSREQLEATKTALTASGVSFKVIGL